MSNNPGRKKKKESISIAEDENANDLFIQLVFVKT